MNQTKEDLVIGPEETTMDTSPLETDISLIVITEVRQDTGRITDKMEDTITTVSYTHLDVYKRQVETIITITYHVSRG